MDKHILDQCEREALHLSAAIQPHGCLIVADAGGRVSHVSANIEAFSGLASCEWLKNGLSPELALLANQELASEPGSRLLREGGYEAASNTMLDVVMNRGSDGAVVIELTRPQNEQEWRRQSVRTLPAPPADDAALAEQRQQLVERIAQKTGFQRVMYYQFREEGDGEVVAEARDEDAYGSYMGQRFPASDIPQIARALYLKNPWRLIPDARAEPVPVLGRIATPPDLTWSDLRSVSPVHCVYLANMDVVASLSFPVVVNGTLTALIAAHHRDARILPTALLERCASQVRAHAFALTSYHSQRRMRLLDSINQHFDDVRGALHRHGNPVSAWPEMAEWLIREFHVDGAVLCIDADCSIIGTSFDPESLEIFDRWFVEQISEFVWLTNSLSREVPGLPLTAVAGVLALRINGRHKQGVRLYLTRTEHVHEVAWGGNPDKPTEHHDGVLGIAPRRSFEKWIEKRFGYSRNWDNESRLLALRLRELLQKELLV